jgi:DNA-binding PucR family transcriptional regulator
MSNPFDRLIDLAGANRALMMKLIEITRSNGERQAQIGAKMFAGLAEQAKDQKALPSLPIAQFTECFREIEGAATEAKTAFEAWREQTGNMFSPEAGQVQVSDFLQSWSKLVLAPLETLGKREAEKPAGKSPRAG